MGDYSKLPQDVLEQKLLSVESMLRDAVARPFPFTGPAAKKVAGLIDGRKRIKMELGRRGGFR